MNNTEKFFLVSFILSCIFIFLRLEIVFGDDLHAPFTDDFYYYLTTARNTIELGVVSFDQENLTNGFQPLWFLIILSLKFIFSNEILLNIIIIFVIFILCFFTYKNLNKYLVEIGFSTDKANFISIFCSFLSLFFSKNGMEIGLAIFLFSLSILYLNKNIFIFSVLSFLTFLSRLEFIFLYSIIISHELLIKKKISSSYLIKLSTFPFLLSLYILINLYFFQLPFPESGIAKSLFNDLKFNLETFEFLKVNSYGMKFISVLFLFNIFSFFLLFIKNTHVLTKIFLMTVIIFFITNSLRSPWPLWTWHFFFLALSTPFIFFEIFRILNLKGISILTNLISIFFVVIYFFLFIDNLHAKSDHIQNIAKKIDKYYSERKYEKFAMGDMAGKTSYLLNKKLYQLEGLTSGVKMIEFIKKEKNLCKVLIDLDIEVYFASKITSKNGVILIEEPSGNSKNLKKMRGYLRIKPANIFKSGNIKVYAFEIKSENDCFFN